jgi:hypothetical protein
MLVMIKKRPLIRPYYRLFYSLSQRAFIQSMLKRNYNLYEQTYIVDFLKSLFFALCVQPHQQISTTLTILTTFANLPKSVT